MKMMYSIKKELGNTYLIMDADKENLDDYRYKMLSGNTIGGIIPLTVRTINTGSQLYYDVSDKINLIKYLSIKNLDYKGLTELIGALMETSENLVEYLIDENCMVLDTDLIFKDVKTGKWEFICIPNDDSENDKLTELMSEIISYVKTDDEAAVKAAFDAFELVSAGNPRFKTLYETVIKAKEPETEEKTEMIVKEEPKEKEDFLSEYITPRYKPSFKEWLCAGLAGAGTLSLGVWLYLTL